MRNATAGHPTCRRANRVAEFDAANPGMGNRRIAAALGVDEKTVRNARKKLGADQSAPEKRLGRDGNSYPATRPTTIDNPPKGELWDDQNDRADQDDQVEKRIGRDGKERRMPVKLNRSGPDLAS
jgi:hypothetical protein